MNLPKGLSAVLFILMSLVTGPSALAKDWPPWDLILQDPSLGEPSIQSRAELLSTIQKLQKLKVDQHSLRLAIALGQDCVRFLERQRYRLDQPNAAAREDLLDLLRWEMIPLFNRAARFSDDKNAKATAVYYALTYTYLAGKSTIFTALERIIKYLAPPLQFRARILARQDPASKASGTLTWHQLQRLWPIVRKADRGLVSFIPSPLRWTRDPNPRLIPLSPAFKRSSY